MNGENTFDNKNPMPTGMELVKGTSMSTGMGAGMGTGMTTGTGTSTGKPNYVQQLNTTMELSMSTQSCGQISHMNPIRTIYFALFMNNILT